MKTLPQLHFDNRFLRDLPADSNSENYPRQVFQSLYSRVKPKVFANPELIAAAEDVAALLDLSPAEFFQVASYCQAWMHMQPVMVVINLAIGQGSWVMVVQLI
jgi:serine/tyrosine/threonine adenylyltransferase